MESIHITIDWVYFLGIVGFLITLAWLASGRYVKIETDIEWMKTDIGWIKKLLHELKIGDDNKDAGAFASESPVSLTLKGEEILIGSGMKKYIELNTEFLMEQCHAQKDDNAYKVQQYIFDAFDALHFPDVEYKKFQQFAFEEGVSMEIIRRVGAIYFRDICLRRFGHQKEDVDRHDPEKNLEPV